MAEVIAKNGRQALVKTIQEILKWGREVRPRGLLTKELRHQRVEIEDPYDTLCTGIGRGQSVEVAASEALQLIGAFSDTEFAVHHAPALAQFVNEHTGLFDGAYGPRALNQVPDIIARLDSDRDTRQAVLAIWDESDAVRWGSKDYPCTLSLAFFIRDDKLELDVTMRSNDVWWGFTNDIFQFSQLQLSFANVLGLEAGPYRHLASSMHLYERDFEKAQQLLDSVDTVDLYQVIPDHPTGVSGTNAADLMRRAKLIALNEQDIERTLSDVTDSERWYRRALGLA